MAKRGAPPKVVTRSHRVTVRATARERAAWQAEAEARGLRLSEWARMALNAATGGEG